MPTPRPGSMPTSDPVRPPARFDPWVWIAALSVIPLVMGSLGAPLGEPVAEDFDFLHHARLLGRHGLLDGGGSLAFWRPIPHQLYYTALGGLLLDHPLVVPTLHTALLGLAAVLLYRALRPAWSRPLAAMAAGFPFLSESVRTVIAWPGLSVETGALLFTALALHEASRRRLATSMVSLALGLLCKEPLVVAGLLLPFWPDARGGPSAADAGAATLVKPRQRVRWAAASAAVMLGWGLAYLAVRRSAGLALPHALETRAMEEAASIPERLSWAVTNSVRAMLSLPAASGPGDFVWIFGALAIVGAAALVLLFRRTARSRLRGMRAWILGGLTWFAMSTAMLGTVYPFWAPNRVLLGSVGAGVAATAFLGCAHPGLAAAMVALRLGAFAASPGAVRQVALEAPSTGAFMDFQQLSRLQRLMRLTRSALRTAHPSLPHGAVVTWSNMPHGAVYAFGGNRALQVWYGDTTLRWVSVEATLADRRRDPVAFVQYQQRHEPQVAVADPRAFFALTDAESSLAAGVPERALAELARADSLAAGSGAVVLAADIGARRVGALAALGRGAEGEREARRVLAKAPENVAARFQLAAIRAGLGDLADVRRHLDTLAALLPGDTLVDRLRRIAAEPATPPPPAASSARRGAPAPP